MLRSVSSTLAGGATVDAFAIGRVKLGAERGAVDGNVTPLARVAVGNG